MAATTLPDDQQAREPLPRPPAWAHRHERSIPLVLLGLGAYLVIGHVLPIPGAFGAPDLLSGQAVLNEWLLLAAVVTGFHLVFGVAGRFAFSMAALMGVGAYTSHALTRASGLHWTVGLAGAVAVALVLSSSFALAVRRAQHFYFAVATLGLAEVLLLVFRRWQLLTGRSSGEIAGTADLTLLGWAADTRVRHFWILLVFLGLVLALAAAVHRSPFGRVAIAARDHPDVLETTGIEASRPGVVLFTLGSVLAAVAGSLFVHTRGLGSPTTFGIELGIGIFVALILGGLHSIWGGLIGAWFYVYVPLYLERWQEWTQVLWGAVLVAVMVAFPHGLVGVAHAVRDRLRGVSGPPPPPPSSSATRPDPAPAPPAQPAVAARARTDVALAVRDLSVDFGGVRACREVSLEVAAGEVVGLTGPNGSGKSTLLNAVSGLVPATGRLVVDGDDTPLQAPRRVRDAGVVRAFQTPHVWESLTCLENATLGSPDRHGLTLTAAVLGRRSMRASEQARWAAAATALDRVGLGGMAERSAGALTYGQRRLLELARCIVARPTVLLLDEPAAGLNQSETDLLGDLLVGLRAEGVSLLVVDHKIDFLDRLADRLVVLELGRVLASGTPEQVWRDPRVIAAYLGTAGRGRQA